MRISTLIITALVSFAVTAVAGAFLVPALRAAKVGQSILDIGPAWHKNKEGTPTMGGLMFIVGISVACLTGGAYRAVRGDMSHIFILLFALIYAAIGFFDDFEALRKKRNLGLTARQKFFMQLAVAIFFVVVMRFTGNLSSRLYVPFVNVTVMLPEPVYLVLASFIIVASVNAVNITDGVDGLAACVSLPVAVSCAAIAFSLGYAAAGLAAAALAGGLVGFLIFNFHPAKVFMGDTGSLFLGAVICSLAFAMDMPLILAPLGVVYIAETMSDIIQVTYFKLTNGKRLFKMAPLHHHFEMSGWSEYRVVGVFTCVSAVFAVISYFAAAARNAFA
ncbi:MAG: phospho-N-acetylmuramoyl-pentapeptide-transferase [Oscillospiraceae bacterium]|jgi:phospho-N-acetylmuramoyl-pentapeptide-transferase|nr:phospho-N-acetylmuramoyl-pentapeptide-transferase [Oscillospiraceae bacterium]